MQQIAHQLEYRLIKRRIETGAIGWAKWLEEENHPYDVSDSDDKEQQDCHNSSVDSDSIAGHCAVSPGSESVALEQIIVATGGPRPAFLGEIGVPPVDDLFVMDQKEDLFVMDKKEVPAAGSRAMGPCCVEEATRKRKVAYPILLFLAIQTTS